MEITFAKIKAEVKVLQLKLRERGRPRGRDLIRYPWQTLI